MRQRQPSLSAVRMLAMSSLRRQAAGPGPRALATEHDGWPDTEIGGPGLGVPPMYQRDAEKYGPSK